MAGGEPGAGCTQGPTVFMLSGGGLGFPSPGPGVEVLPLGLGPEWGSLPSVSSPAPPPLSRTRGHSPDAVVLEGLRQLCALGKPVCLSARRHPPW